MIWNYRVLKEEVVYKEEVLERFRIIEVYYNDDGIINGWVDCTDSILNITGEIGGHAYEDLKGTAEHVIKAFKLPVLIKGENEKLLELSVEG
ncbi:hypothetical protein [Metabacillus fastidiosus]|uniref:hypothetical protein n=1 Tax=Metabacillus fastidiosus TaxID=1458 RepID=UPI002E21F2CB|nr:hypothetical protein [Metabacillus fastidiosus]